MTIVKQILLLLLIPLQSWSLPISISQVSDLNFGVAYRSDPAKTVAPGTSENSENASFWLQGDPGRSFSIQLPRKIDMISVSGNQKIRVENFTSYPSNVGVLGIGGSTNLFVGASRGAIRGGQQLGAYVGVFTVTVIY